MRSVLAALLILISGAQVKADSDVEHARYSVVASSGDIEIRAYAAPVVTFTMPASYSMKTLPKPNNQAVELIELPPQRLAAIRFSGLVDEGDLSQNQAKLMRFLEQEKLKPIGAPRYAFYDPPWTLPFNRRNEVLIEIARP